MTVGSHKEGDRSGDVLRLRQATQGDHLLHLFDLLGRLVQEDSRLGRSVRRPMTEAAPPLTAAPMKPEAVDGYVEAVDLPNPKLKMTADAAEISAIRLLDTAGKARER